MVLQVALRCAKDERNRRMTFRRMTTKAGPNLLYESWSTVRDSRALSLARADARTEIMPAGVKVCVYGQTSLNK